MNHSPLKIVLRPLFQNKYILSLFGFLIWIAFFDQNNLIERYQLGLKINQLEREKENLTHEVEQNKRKIKELRGNREKLEKFAREEYLMKKENEVVFVIIEK